MLSARPVGLPLDADRGIATKTPGRPLTKTRNVLQENASRNPPMTVIGKGKKLVQNTPLQSKTLQTDRVLKDLPGKQVAPTIRPLGDKTPFPNRTANHLQTSGTKIAKPALVDGSLRPSSARKHDSLPRSAGKAFETPVTDGKHWDVSDIDIEVDVPVANKSIEEASCDEIEYMPPKVEDVPYEPPFEMPNYREVGKTLIALIRSYTLEDDPPSTDLTFTPHTFEQGFFARPTLPQQEIEDDGPFARAKPEPEVPKQDPTVTRKSTLRSATQRTAPGARTSPTNARVPPTVRRPPTSATCRPPLTTRTSSSQPVTRAPTSQSTLRAPSSRATTRAPSVARSAPLVRANSVQLARAPSLSRPSTKPVSRPAVATASVKDNKAATPRACATPVARNPASLPNGPSNAGRPRSGTITKAEFDANAHVGVYMHLRNNSLEDVKKDLEGLVVFGDAFDGDDGFRFDV